MSQSWWNAALREFERHLRAQNRRPLTIHGYLRDMQQLQSWMLAHGRGDAVPDTADLRHWLAELQAAGATGATLARKRSAAQHFFAFVADIGLIRRAPTEGLELPTHEYVLPRTLSRQEVAALLAAAADHPRDYAILQVLLGCAVRVSELCALTRTQIDAANRLLYVAGRVVPIPDATWSALEAWLQQHPGLTVFPIKQRMVRILCEKYRVLAGIAEPVTPSLLRHTSAVWQLVDGADPETLKIQLGHDRDDVMLHYIDRARQLQEHELRAWRQESLF
ncbi:tyrosine-type recombinase/integrase [Kallotenue papyrolyticum]|uniref:tyrosine-type recombinase/integrase n=1 Tax=Kallotenue papyrolyticum TaxID=1325125 RepID=UPI0004716C7C|nr:tyrosine-type recombinase/integrase [Kallotenue papyrolyticum]